MGRRKGTSAFPVARIKKMMQSDDDVGKIATVTPVLVAKALECMMENVLHEAADIAHSRHSNTILPQHLKACVMRNESFDFLRHVFKRVETPQEGASDPPIRRRRRTRHTSAATPNSSSDTPSFPFNKRPRSPASSSSSDHHQPKTHRTETSTDPRSPSTLPRLPKPFPQALPQPPIPSSAPLDDDDDDYDEDDQDQPEPTIIEQSNSVPPPSEDAAAAAIEINPKRTADRVSVQALVS
ncbi:unnamed protein product [Agarophyton chilense]